MVRHRERVTVSAGHFGRSLRFTPETVRGPDAVGKQVITSGHRLARADHRLRSTEGQRDTIDLPGGCRAGPAGRAAAVGTYAGRRRSCWADFRALLANIGLAGSTFIELVTAAGTRDRAFAEELRAFG